MLLSIIYALQAQNDSNLSPTVNSVNTRDCGNFHSGLETPFGQNEHENRISSGEEACPVYKALVYYQNSLPLRSGDIILPTRTKTRRAGIQRNTEPTLEFKASKSSTYLNDSLSWTGNVTSYDFGSDIFRIANLTFRQTFSLGLNRCYRRAGFVIGSGCLGLSPRSSNIVTFMENAINAGVLPRPAFSLVLPKDQDQRPGEILFGAIDHSQYAASLAFAEIPSTDKWNFIMSNVTYGNRVLGAAHVTKVDISNQATVFPLHMAQALHDQWFNGSARKESTGLDKSWLWRVPCYRMYRTSPEKLEFTMGGKVLSLLLRLLIVPRVDGPYTWCETSIWGLDLDDQNCSAINSGGASLSYYRQAAERGDAAAQFTLAQMYEQGQGVEASEAEAVKWYRKAAEGGNAEAQFSLAQLYDDGRGVKEDLDHAARWYRRAADQGHADAQYKMGSWCSLGFGVEESNVEAVYWYRKAALQGHAAGQLNLGYMYHSGQGLKKDDVEAVAWYRKAAEQGEEGALMNLGVMYYHGYGVVQSYTQAVALYRQAADQGDQNAKHKLATMYEDGLGVKQDYAEAVAWFLEAAEQGYHEAQYDLAVKYIQGLGVEKNLTAGISWLLKAALQDHAAAQSYLGSMYASGIGVKQSDIVAARWYKKAAARNDAMAMFNLGCFYYHGRGVEQCYCAALSWHRMASDLGNEMSPRNIGYMYEAGRGVKQSQREAVKWYLISAERGDVKAQLHVAEAFLHGRGVEKNIAEASKWFSKAAEQDEL
ncbi:hypothetical protein EC968_007098 [Mortierella alpina]|nr:hypothetical protein EC968_007098 [Mortierella alpina]